MEIVAGAPLLEGGINGMWMGGLGRCWFGWRVWINEEMIVGLNRNIDWLHPVLLVMRYELV